MPLLTFLLSPAGRYIGAALAVIALLGGAYLWIDRQATERALQGVSEQDLIRSDDIRESTREVRRRNEARNPTLSDDDLDNRLRDIRGQ